MTIENLLAVLGWCLMINFSLLLVWIVAFRAAPEFIYKTQHAFVPISREEFNVAMYRFLGYFKMTVLVFNFAPYIALRIVF